MEKALEEEKSRVSNYLNTESEARLLQVLDKELLEKKETVSLQSFLRTCALAAAFTDSNSSPGAAGEGRQRAEGAAAQQHARRHLAHVPPLLQNNRQNILAHIHTSYVHVHLPSHMYLLRPSLWAVAHRRYLQESHHRPRL